MSSVSSSVPYSLLHRAAVIAGTALVGWAERRAQAAEQNRRRRRAKALRLCAQQAAAEKHREEALLRSLLHYPRHF